MITIVTGSPRKRKEISSYIKDRIEYTFIAKDLDEIQGTSEEIIRNKAKAAHEIVQGPVVVEDYSLYIQKLSGFPGPYVKSVLKNGELAEIVNNLSQLGEITCTAECFYAYIDKNNEFHLFSTKANGILIPSENKFNPLYGVDEFLIQNGTTVPYAQLSDAEKDENSIRRLTIEKLIQHLNQNPL
ncbi:Ham1 family protein [Nematocida ausubeli]|uniref:Ham1 family protein n=1 Tax=Nematocida ausubeli (strain ATCC PRA-371 / ERTm2) TaxID=1913371 RepID=A0A086J5L9_NEMA1|nr:Ham1 family protein [Nematocida ausubeli]KAI5139023.1 inosine triphosphate pyrophosphatase [Nematocida ausubeli]KFG27437.1 Ham1 family protein [Nematocida ausubeli]